VFPNPFVTADQSILGSFTVAWVYFRNSISMGGIDKSHAQKVSGVTTSIPLEFRGPVPVRDLGVVEHCPKACCTLVFDTVLDIRTSEKIMFSMFSELLRSRMVLLTPGCDDSNFQTRSQINTKMTIKFPDDACAITCTWKAYLLLKRQFKNKKQMNEIFYDITPILGSSADYCEKRSHDRMVY